MKKVALVIGIGLIGLAFMGSTCSAPEQVESSKGLDRAEMKNEVAKAEVGIDFKKMRLNKAKEEALKSGKLIFIDAYTSWCGPCKQMAATSFKDEEVGNIYNENFINLKIEMEKDEDGPEVARMYNVRAYPTLLVIDGEGNLVKQVIGFQTKDRLIALAESVL